MDTTTLGRTGLQVSVVGLGGGGYSQLGLGTGGDEANAEAVVRRALDLGINFIDTAESYGTQQVIARVLKGVPRDSVVLSIKKWAGKPDEYCTPQAFREGVETCLRELATDFIDVFHCHSARPESYDYICGEIVPVLQTLRDEGKIRFLGITEMFNADPSHQMLSRAVADDYWDVIMAGLKMLNPSANRTILPAAADRGIGSLIMFAVRNALSQPQRLAEVVDQLIAEGHIDGELVDRDSPLGFLTADGDASSIVEAAYRYCRHQRGVDVVLTGTGSAEHLKDNVRSVLSGPLPDEALATLETLFGRVDSISGS